MENTRNKGLNTKLLAQIALLIAIELVMRLLGLGSVPIGPLNMSFLTLPVAIGAMLIGPAAGLILGAVFGITSLWDAISGRSAMTAFFFQYSPVATILLCVGMRILMGLGCAYVFKLFSKLDRDEKTWSYFVGALSAPLLNTFFFMGFIVLFFYNTEFVQNLVALKGAVNPIHFVIVLVGVQGLIEAVSVGVLGGILAKVLSKAVKR